MYFFNLYKISPCVDPVEGLSDVNKNGVALFIFFRVWRK
jgi:hypothetical protein